MAFRDIDVFDRVSGIGKRLPRFPRRGEVGLVIAASEDGDAEPVGRLPGEPLEVGGGQPSPRDQQPEAPVCLGRGERSVESVLRAIGNGEDGPPVGACRDAVARRQPGRRLFGEKAPHRPALMIVCIAGEVRIKEKPHDRFDLPVCDQPVEHARRLALARHAPAGVEHRHRVGAVVPVPGGQVDEHPARRSKRVAVDGRLNRPSAGCRGRVGELPRRQVVGRHEFGDVMAAARPRPAGIIGVDPVVGLTMHD